MRRKYDIGAEKGVVMSERVGRVVEKKLERVGRIYLLELRFSKCGCESKA
jgi:hypothetical protein